MNAIFCRKFFSEAYKNDKNYDKISTFKKIPSCENFLKIFF